MPQPNHRVSIDAGLYKLLLNVLGRRPELEEIRTELQSKAEQVQDMQQDVGKWMRATFPPEIIQHKNERNHRFLEEAVELVQVCGLSEEEALMLVRRTYSRPVGEFNNEVGGAYITLCALVNAYEADLNAIGAEQLQWCWDNLERIKAKQKLKPPSGAQEDHERITASEQKREAVYSTPVAGCAGDGVVWPKGRRGYSPEPDDGNSPD